MANDNSSSGTLIEYDAGDAASAGYSIDDSRGYTVYYPANYNSNTPVSIALFGNVNNPSLEAITSSNSIVIMPEIISTDKVIGDTMYASDVAVDTNSGNLARDTVSIVNAVMSQNNLNGSVSILGFSASVETASTAAALSLLGDSNVKITNIVSIDGSNEISQKYLEAIGSNGGQILIINNNTMYDYEMDDTLTEITNYGGSVFMMTVNGDKGHVKALTHALQSNIIDYINGVGELTNLDLYTFKKYVDGKWIEVTDENEIRQLLEQYISTLSMSNEVVISDLKTLKDYLSAIYTQCSKIAENIYTPASIASTISTFTTEEGLVNKVQEAHSLSVQNLIFDAKYINGVGESLERLDDLLNTQIDKLKETINIETDQTS